MQVKFTADFKEAMRKTAVLKAIPKAFRFVAKSWGSETVQVLKRSAAAQQKSRSGKGKTGDMARGVGQELSGDENAYRIAVGTGVGGEKNVIYAKIQDEGGIIHMKDKMLTIPLDGVQGRIANFPDGFFIKSKGGDVLFVVRKYKKVSGGMNSKATDQLIPLFLLKKEVKIPASFWFTGPMRQRIEYLAEAARPENVLKIAENLAEV